MSNLTCASCSQRGGSVRLVEHGTDDIPLCKSCFKSVQRQFGTRSAREEDSRIDEVANRIYGQYNPESRGKSPSVTRAACEYLAYLSLGRRDDVDQQSLADEYGCSPHSIRVRKNEILEIVDMHGLT